jgi:LCP family protein required for cell wall assembly
VSPDPDKPPRPGRGVLKKAALAGVLITLLTAATVSSAVLLEVDELVDIVRAKSEVIAGVDNVLDDVDGGGPQTILVIGSDKRWQDEVEGNPARSDTMILVRLNPDREATALLSIPRDLRAEIPGYGTERINAAYSAGGAKLALRTVRNLLDVPIHHIVEVNFGGFRRAVDRLDCVYTDIDRRYYHSNEGLPASQHYAEINIKPGYQKLCGRRALEYVRYRHTDSDFVRGARQQDFLGQAKSQFGLSEILGDRKKLVEIFSTYTRTDIRSNEAILRLLKLAFQSSKNPIQEVRFDGALDAEGGYVTISPERLAAMRERFLNAKASKGPRQTESSAKSRATKKQSNRKKKAKKRQTTQALPPGVIYAKKEGETVAVQAAKELRLPTYYPAARLARGGYGSGERDYPAARAYKIRDRSKKRYDAYRLVLYAGEAGQYYGVQGTSWKSPPILDSPTETEKMRGRKYEMFYDGDRLRLIAWRTPRGAYWVSNTLSQKLTNRQMRAIARSLTRIGS